MGSEQTASGRYELTLSAGTLGMSAEALCSEGPVEISDEHLGRMVLIKNKEGATIVYGVLQKGLRVKNKGEADKDLGYGLIEAQMPAAEMVNQSEKVLFLINSYLEDPGYSFYVSEDANAGIASALAELGDDYEFPSDEVWLRSHTVKVGEDVQRVLGR